MISRRDNLLNRPWQERRYENHRRKVQSALPAIDNTPPAARNHVTLKLKKCQKEGERIHKIEQDNLTLLRRLSYTMRKNHVDNHWTKPQPNFLNRVAMYNNVVPRIEDIQFDSELSETSLYLTGRKARCYACTPPKSEELKIPNERVPWEPPKQSVRRVRSKSVPACTTESLPAIKEEVSDASTQSRTPPRRPKTSLPITHHKKYSKVKPVKLDFESESAQRIILSRGCLKLAVNFPPDTFIKFQDGANEKVIMHGLCNCNKRLNVVC